MASFLEAMPKRFTNYSRKLNAYTTGVYNLTNSQEEENDIQYNPVILCLQLNKMCLLIQPN